MGGIHGTNFRRSVGFTSGVDVDARTLLVCVAVALVASITGGRGLGARSAEVPVINGNLGPCTSDFTVTDSSNKPVYNAKIHVTILYGFMNKRKSDLEIGTNADGNARFEGLPDKLKKPPMKFTIHSGDQNSSVTNDPALDCHPSFTVTLEK